jgi:phosphoheptose isomerase
MQRDIRNTVRDYLATSTHAFRALSGNPILHGSIVQAAETINEAFARGSRLYIAGNGGSAADAQHFAAELVGYYGSKADKPLPARALTTDTSFMTAWGNDASFDTIFARQLQADAREGDVLFAISTSGNSANILRALEAAKDMGMHRIGLLGETGAATFPGVCDIHLRMPARGTPHVQELHIAVIHAICECLDR